MENEELIHLKQELFKIRFEMTTFRRRIADDPIYAAEIKNRLSEIKKLIAQEMMKQEGGKTK